MMNYKLGLVSVSFRKNSPREILEAMKGAGLSCIEWGSDVHCPPEEAEKIALLQKEYGAECCSYGTYFTICSTPAEELIRYIRAAKMLGTDILRLWAGKGKGYAEYTEAEKQAFYEECRRLAAIAEQEEVTLCMECHNGTFTDCKEGAIALMEAVGSAHFRMYWQPNQYRSEEENLRYAALLAPYTYHLHVFNWKEKEKFPLAEGIAIWKEYLSRFEGGHHLLLEFMPDGSIETLPREAEALRRMIQ